MFDHSKFRQHQTSRGYTYNYYFAPAVAGKPYLFFSHGFPSCAYLWRKQIAFFEPLGYGLVVPDLLGYGGTDKPSELSGYYGSGLARDIVDILDKEGIDKVVSISHGWGSRVASRIWNWHPDRLIACSFWATGYGPPSTSYADPVKMMKQIAEWIGYDILGYMELFIQKDTAALMEKNFDSFMSLLFPITGKLWLHNMCTADGAKRWLETNTVLPLPDYMKPEDAEYYRKNLLGGGFEGPLCWYRVLVDDGNNEDDASAKQSSYDMNIPVQYINFTDDWIAKSDFADMSHNQYVKGPYTKKLVDCDHWGVISHADILNPMLLEWLGSLKV